MGVRRGWSQAGGLAGRIVAGVAIVTAPVALTMATGQPAGAAPTPLYIGSVLGVTGSFGNFALPEEAGLKAVVKEIDKAGGVLGHKLVYVNVNDTSTVTKDSAAIQQLLGEHKYLAVFPTPVGFPAMLNYTNAEHIISFGGQAPSPSNDTFNPAKWPYDFGDSAPVPDYELGVAEALIKLAGHGGKLGVIETTKTTAQAQVPPLEADFTKLGGKVAGTETVAATATNVTQQATALQNDGATVLYSFQAESLCTATMNAVAALHWTTVKILNNQDCLSTQEIQAVPGSIKSQVKFIGVSTEIKTPKTGGPNKKIARFAKDALAIDPQANVSISAVSGTAVRDLVWAIRKAKSTKETRVLKELNSLRKAKVPASTWLQMPDPRWSSTVHTMITATFSGYYGLITPAPGVNGTYKGAVLTYTAKRIPFKTKT